MDESKKKITVHVGYSKTGTTTLQNSLFYNLHMNGKINYLGISKSNISKYHNEARQQLMPWLRSSGIVNERELFSIFKERLKEGYNLCSEESFTNSFQFPPRLFPPEIIKNIFSKLTDNIQIVIVLRNQMQFFYSLFVHSGGQYSQNEFNTANKFIDYCITNSETCSYFKFYDVIQTYHDVFGKQNVHVLFFEDFLYNQDYYLAKWAELLCQPLEIIRSCLGDSHFYKKLRSNDGSYYAVLKKKEHKWKLLFRKFRIPSYLNSIFSNLTIYNKFKTIINEENSSKKLIPKFTDEQNFLIKSFFLENNRKLLELLECDIEKFERYNYL